MSIRPIHRVLTVGVAAALLFGLAACGSDDEPAAPDEEATPIESLADMAGKRIGVQTGTTGGDFANENAPESATIVEYEDTIGLFGALDSGDIDGILQDLPVNAARVAEVEGLALVETFPTGENYGFAVEKGNTLRDDLNGALQTVRDDGTYDLIFEKYFPVDGAEPGPGPEPSDVEGTTTFKVCSEIPYPPMEFEGEGPRGLEYTGFDIDLLDAMAVELDAKLEILAVGFDGILGNLAAGTCDIVASSVTIDDERSQEVDFTEPYFESGQSLLVKAG